MVPILFCVVHVLSILWRSTIISRCWPRRQLTSSIHIKPISPLVTRRVLYRFHLTVPVVARASPGVQALFEGDLALPWLTVSIYIGLENWFSVSAEVKVLRIYWRKVAATLAIGLAGTHYSWWWRKVSFVIFESSFSQRNIFYLLWLGQRVLICWLIYLSVIPGTQSHRYLIRPLYFWFLLMPTYGSLMLRPLGLLVLLNIRLGILFTFFHLVKDLTLIIIFHLGYMWQALISSHHLIFFVFRALTARKCPTVIVWFW